ncbi:MAG: hypothetical protein Q9163_004572 [Psora crenata]
MAPQGPVRRNGTTTTKISDPATTTMPPTTSTSLPVPFALLPTTFEMLLLAVYPSTLLLGSLFSLLDPSARKAPYNPVSQSHPPAHAPSYFALKRNILNTYFVKRCWFWVSLAYLVFLLLHTANGPRGLVLTPRRLRGLVRYGIATVWWVGVTQWLFGPPLIDRGFLLTGGACELASQFEGTGGKTEFLTSQACKVAGGTWSGGHDISGHVFILVLGSAFLIMEVLPVLVAMGEMPYERAIMTRDGRLDGVKSEIGPGSDGGGDLNSSWAKVGVGMPVIVAGLGWFMLLMTAAYFHTWFEKVSPEIYFQSWLLEQRLRSRS